MFVMPGAFLQRINQALEKGCGHEMTFRKLIAKHTINQPVYFHIWTYALSNLRHFTLRLLHVVPTSLFDLILVNTSSGRISFY